jgi:hypothetical protein
MPARSSDRRFAGALTVTLLAALVLAGPRGRAPQAATVPVTSLKAFTSEAAWQLDITWSAKDSYADKDWSAGLETTATARYVLRQLDRKQAWGHWQVQSVESANLTYKSFLKNNHTGARTDYQASSGPAVAAMADLQIGENTPGYLLVCQVAYPLKVKDTAMGAFDTLAPFVTTEEGKPGLSGVATTGPLPPYGTTIHGSAVVPLGMVPFGSSAAPKTRVGIQWVLKPYADPLAPLVPGKKK